jgi:Domain of unknown function (DUF4279)
MNVDHDRQALRELSGGHPADRRYVWYSLGGADLDPGAVSRSTGIKPDRSWLRGDPKPRTGIPYTGGAWLLESGLGPSDEFHDHLDALLNRLRPAWSAFVGLGHEYEATVEAAIYLLEAQGPLVQLLPDVAKALGELNATLGFDLYALPEETDPAPQIRRLSRAEVATLSRDIHQR